jgi:hypothetical protein
MPRTILKKTLILPTLLLCLFICKAQTDLSSALNRLEKARLISGREKKLLQAQYAEWEKGRKTSPVGLPPMGWPPSPDYSRNEQLLRLLTQAKQFSTSGVSTGFSFDPAPASYRHLSPAAIRVEQDTFIRRLFRAGLISGWTREKLLQNKNSVNHYSDILKSFKNLVFEIDMEYGVDSGQYKRLTQRVALFSKYQFRPDKIIDTYSYTHKNFIYGFTLDGKAFTAALHQGDDWLDPGFWDLIEKAEKEKDSKGQFHHIYPSDGLSEIYLTNEQFAFLETHALLEFTNPE